jgi:hypothetical protein
MIANSRLSDSSLSATAQNRWERTPDVVLGLEETSSGNPLHEPHAASQTYIFLTHNDSSELPMEESSRDEASSEPQDLWRSSAAVASRM